jgi:hypothetical protein
MELFPLNETKSRDVAIITVRGEVRKMSKDRDLCLVLKYNEKPIRVGVCGTDVIFSLSDLISALNLKTNVTHIAKRLPEETFYKGSYVNVDNGLPTNGLTYVVTYEGAFLSLARVHGVDLYDVLNLMRWALTVKAEKIKKGA